MKAILLLIFLGLVPLSGQAQAPAAKGARHDSLPPPAKPIAPVPGVLPWMTLAQVDLAKENNRYVPKYSPEVLALNNREVKLQGYMIPLAAGSKVSKFLLTGLPQNCSFCLPGGPEAMVEVSVRNPIRHTFDPITVSGKLAVLKSDPTGMYYRIAEGTVLP